MLPLSALIILGAVGTFSTLTFSFAVYHTIKTRLEARRLKSAQPDSDMSIPLAEAAITPGTAARTWTPIPRAPRSTPPTTRPGTPEAEYPPPLPQELEIKVYDSRAKTSPSSPSSIAIRPRTPDVNSSTPLRVARECETQAEDSVRAETPPPLNLANRDRLLQTKRDRDSMHEIYEIYSKLPTAPKSAPPGTTTFATAESKWTYFGQKRAEEMNMV